MKTQESARAAIWQKSALELFFGGCGKKPQKQRNFQMLYCLLRLAAHLAHQIEQTAENGGPVRWLVDFSGHLGKLKLDLVHR